MTPELQRRAGLVRWKCRKLDRVLYDRGTSAAPLDLTTPGPPLRLLNTDAKVDPPQQLRTRH